jgi:murein L,D-transpeptidase YcbB/YkuD
VRRNKAVNTVLHPHRLADLDLLLTDALGLYGAHLSAGRVNPETIRAEWFMPRRPTDLVRVLQSALATGQIAPSLRSLLPPQPGYAALRQGLARYRELAARGGKSAEG